MKELGEQKACLALGYFDSVHLGHRTLIEAAREYAVGHGIACAVATFSNNAYRQFNAEEKQVYTFAERCDIFSGLCDLVLPMRFDSRLKKYSAEEFLSLVIAHHNIAAFVCGYDYSFGSGAKGDAQLLKSFAASHGIDCVVLPKYELDGERVSTTDIKKLLRDGNIEKANSFLGAPFFVTGKVVRGRGAGRMFDIPTANIKFPSSKLVPQFGVYGTTCEIGGKTYYGATNVGGRPTFGLTKPVIETFIVDFNDNIYDTDIKVVFHKRLRDITRFDTPVQLSKQVHTDTEWYK